MKSITHPLDYARFLVQVSSERSGVVERSGRMPRDVRVGRPYVVVFRCEVFTALGFRISVNAAMYICNIRTYYHDDPLL